MLEKQRGAHPNKKSESSPTKTSKASLKGYLPKGAVVMARSKAKSPKGQEVNVQPPVNTEQFLTLESVSAHLEGCMRCKLSQLGRSRIVFGEGNPRAELVFVGEAPGEQEDIQGRPFVGRAGQLLDKMMAAIGLNRQDIYICNVVKCRPPENRNPEPDEISSCGGYLRRQIELIKPKVIVALGKFSAQTLLQTETRISELRGNFYPYQGAKLIPTFHPSYLLRNPSAKKEVWEDLQKVAKELGIKIPKS